MTWISQVILLLVASSTAYAVLQMASTCDSYKYGGNCTVRCTNFKGQDHEMYYNNKKVVNGDTYDVSVQFNIQLVVKMKLTMDTAGEYSCKAPGMTTTKAVVKMEVEAKAPKAMYYLLIGSKATVNTTVYGYPKPATYTYKKKSGDGTYQTVAQYNTKTNLMDVGIGKYEISGQNAHLTVTKVVLSDGGDYQVTDGGTSTASFKIEAGSPPKIKTKPAPSYDVVSGVAATFKCEFESLDKLTVVTWVYTAKGVPSRTITKKSTGAVTLDGTNLKITPVLANKDDSFKCVGSSVFGKDEASTVIGNVYTKPAIKAMTNLKIDVGSKKDISCEATGGPNLAVSWMKRGKDGRFTELTGQVKTPGKSVYSIASAKLADGGDYKCTAVITPKPELKDEAIVSVDVLSAPEFTFSPPTAVTVSENSNLEIKVQMDGNPKPSAIFQWPHDSSKDQTIPGTQLYPYIYESAYTLNNIPASFCGRLLTTRLTNNVGTSATIRTNVMVLLKLDADPNLGAGKPSPGCVLVKWNQSESGACFVRCEIQFKAGSEVVTTKVMYNTNTTAICYKTGKVNITNVQLTMSFKKATRTFTAKVSESPIPTTPAAAQGKDTILGLAVVVATETTLLIVIIAFLFVKGRRILQRATKKEPEEGIGNVEDEEMQYMEMQHANLEADSNYASLQPQYEEIGKKVSDYENVDRVDRV